MLKTEFIDKAWDAAVEAKRLGAKISVPVVVAQAALESAYGISKLAVDNNNLFGIKGDYNGNYAEYETKEQRPDGSWYTTKARFRAYDSWEECFGDYASIIERLPWYQDAEDAAHSPVDFLKGIVAKVDPSGQVIEPGWATDKTYYEKVWGIMVQHSLLERSENPDPEEFSLLQVYDNGYRLDFEPIKHTIGSTEDGGIKCMIRVKPTTFLQRLRYLFSRG
jgi:flagellum-specific peptidoglycan hydrolase FlgJ